MKKGQLIQFAAGRFYQGKGVLEKLGSEAALLGSRALMVAEDKIWDKVKSRAADSLDKAGVEWKHFSFSGWCCPGQYENAASMGREFGAQAVIGIGGGRAVDTAKIVSDKIGVRSITVPTSAATCAASAWLSVHYTDEGHFQEQFNYWTKLSPFAILLDMDVVALDCPPRCNAAGMIDAMAKYPEISYNILYSHNWQKNVFSHTARKMAETTYKLYLDKGVEVYEKLNRGVLDQQVEDLLGAAVQLTGLISCMACGGKQAAVCHMLYGYFCDYYTPLSIQWMHGELVGASLPYQLAANGAPREEVQRLIDFIRHLGAPACLKDLGFDTCKENMDAMFAYLKKRMPIETEEEYQRLRSYEQVLISAEL